MHRWECGCGKSSCAEMGLEDCTDDDYHESLCMNEHCRHYYDHRDDNCDCDDTGCPYCSKIPSCPVKEKKKDDVDKNLLIEEEKKEEDPLYKWYIATVEAENAGILSNDEASDLFVTTSKPMLNEMGIDYQTWLEENVM